MLWMDTSGFMSSIVDVSSNSKYSLKEIEVIYWNEVYPVVRWNMWCLPIPDWEGYNIDWLSEKIIKRQDFKKPLKKSRFKFYAYKRWQELEREIRKLRN